jgi:hypothetical protein
VVSKTRMETFTLFAIFNLCLCNVIYINDSRLSDICELLNSIIDLAIIFLLALLKLFFSIGFCLAVEGPMIWWNWEFGSSWELTSEATAHLPSHSFLVTPSPEMILRKISQGNIHHTFRKSGAGKEFVLPFGTVFRLFGSFFSACIMLPVDVTLSWLIEVKRCFSGEEVGRRFPERASMIEKSHMRRLKAISISVSGPKQLLL